MRPVDPGGARCRLCFAPRRHGTTTAGLRQDAVVLDVGTWSGTAPAPRVRPHPGSVTTSSSLTELPESPSGAAGCPHASCASSPVVGPAGSRLHPPTRSRHPHRHAHCRPMDRLLDWNPTDNENRKLLKHLRKERSALFTFLLDPVSPPPTGGASRPSVTLSPERSGAATAPPAAPSRNPCSGASSTCHQQRVERAGGHR